MYFYEALKEMMEKKCMAYRKNWNGKKQYIQIVDHVSFRNPDGSIYNQHNICIGNKAIAFFGTTGIQIGWLASQADMLSSDWEIIENGEEANERE